MKSFASFTIFILLLAYVAAKPLADDNNEKDCEKKGKYRQVDCAEQLQFANPKATCFMNDLGDFLIMNMDKRKDVAAATATLEDFRTDSPIGVLEDPEYPTGNSYYPKRRGEEIESDTEGKSLKEKDKEESTTKKPDYSAELVLGLLFLGAMAAG